MPLDRLLCLLLSTPLLLVVAPVELPLQMQGEIARVSNLLREVQPFQQRGVRVLQVRPVQDAASVPCGFEQVVSALVDQRSSDEDSSRPLIEAVEFQERIEQKKRSGQF